MAVSGTPEQLLVQHLPFIERIGRKAARRHGLRPEDGEEFVSDLKLKLVADDYLVIRKFKGDSLFTTYLTSVMANYLLDYRDRLWGKWRPSAEAKRLGPLALLLERLVVREGHSLDQAHEIVRVNHRLTVTRAELEDLLAKLPVRSRPRGPAEPLDETKDHADPARRADERLIEEDEDRERHRIAEAVREAVGRLPPEDRVIVRMRIADGFTVSEIARTLGREPKPLYRHLETIFKTLRLDLQGQGIDASVAHQLSAVEPAGEPHWAPRWEKDPTRPSQTMGRV